MLKRMPIIFMFLLSALLPAEELDRSSLSFDMKISEERVFGISSVPVSSWTDQAESADPTSIPPDGKKDIYVFWKVFSTDPLTLSLSGTEMTGDDGEVEWSASWDIDGEEKALTEENEYSPELVYEYEGGRLRSVGSRTITLGTKVISGIPGTYRGKLTLEIVSD